MQISRDDLYRHYASLSDEELSAIDPGDLTEAARQCYTGEVERRRLSGAVQPDREATEDGSDGTVAPDWLETSIMPP